MAGRYMRRDRPVIAPAARYELQAAGLTAVGESLDQPYEILGVVGRSLAQPYNVIGAVGRSLAQPYNVNATAGRSLAQPYNVIGAVGRSLAQPYGIGGPVGRSLAQPYNIIGAVGRSLAQPYNVNTAAGRSLAQPYNVNAAAGRSLAQPYGIIGAVGRSLAQPYGIGGPVGRSLAQPYNVTGVAGRSLAQPYNVLAAAGRSLAQPYGIIGAVGRSLAQPYVILAAAGRSLAQPYLILGLVAVGRSLAQPFGIGGSTGLSLAQPYGIEGQFDPALLIVAGTLGCGVYDVKLLDRGGERVVGDLGATTLSYGRRLVETSEATITLAAHHLEACCGVLALAEPWRHEVAILRNGAVAWVGPLTSMSFPPGAAILRARDLSAWFDRRRAITDRVGVYDLGDLFGLFAGDAFAVDASPGMILVGAPVGITGDRDVRAAQQKIIAPELRELSRSGVDWTVIGRTLTYGPASSTLAGTLLDEHFGESPTVEVDGLRMVNAQITVGRGRTQDEATIIGSASDSSSQTAYGLLEAVAQEDKIGDELSATANAASRVELGRLPIGVIAGGGLTARAPILMQNLIPGHLVRVAVVQTCYPTSGVYRLGSIDVTVNADGSESVVVNLQPVGEETD